MIVQYISQEEDKNSPGCFVKKHHKVSCKSINFHHYNHCTLDCVCRDGMPDSKFEKYFVFYKPNISLELAEDKDTILNITDGLPVIGKDVASFHISKRFCPHEFLSKKIWGFRRIHEYKFKNYYYIELKWFQHKPIKIECSSFELFYANCYCSYCGGWDHDYIDGTYLLSDKTKYTLSIRNIDELISSIQQELRLLPNVVDVNLNKIFEDYFSENNKGNFKIDGTCEYDEYAYFDCFKIISNNNLGIKDTTNHDECILSITTESADSAIKLCNILNQYLDCITFHTIESVFT